MIFRNVCLAAGLVVALTTALLLDLPQDAIWFLVLAAIVDYAAGMMAVIVACCADRTDSWEYDE